MSIPSMPLFCGDYLADTKHLTLEQHGAYMLLLMVTWRNNGRALPDDDVLLSRYLSITKDRWLKKIRPALEPLFDLSGGTWRSARLEREWRYVQEKIAAKRATGALGGRPRKNGPQNGPDFPSPTREQSSETQNDKPLKDNETAKPNGFGSVSDFKTTQPPSSSAYAVEESKGPVCVDTPALPAREDTHKAPPDSVKTANIVPFKPPRVPEVAPLPDGWVLPEAWFDWARGAGHPDPEAAAERFHAHWLGKRDRGDRDAANSEAVWLKHWQGWVRGDIKRERDHGQQRHGGRQRQKSGGNGLAAYVYAEMRRDPGNA